MSADCYPALFWQYPKELDIPANRAAFAQLAEQLRDPIEHHLFYGTIRAWGINPGEAMEKRWAAGLDDGSLQATFGARP